MIGPIANFNTEFWGDFATTSLLQWVIAATLAGAAGWWSGQRLAQRWPSVDNKTGWLVRFPGQALWLLAAFVLPFLGLPWLVELIVAWALLTPPVTLLSWRVHSVHHADPQQETLNRRAVLRTSWQDTAFVSTAFLISGIAALALVPTRC